MQHAIIENDIEKEYLLCQMVGFRNTWGITVMQWGRLLKRLLIDYPTTWSLVKLDQPVAVRPEMADFWCTEFDVWNHSAGATTSHNTLGMAYAWWVTRGVGRAAEINLGDGPDFAGTLISGHRLVGDVGSCTTVAMLDGLKSMGFHDVWVSVLGYNTQVVVELNYGIRALLSMLIRGKGVEADIRRAFYCEEHGEWILPEKSMEWINDRFLYEPDLNPPLLVGVDGDNKIMQSLLGI